MGMTGSLALGGQKSIRLEILGDTNELMLTLKDGAYEEVMYSKALILSAESRRTLPAILDEHAHLFHSRASIRETERSLEIVSCPISAISGAPIPALIARYRFTPHEGGVCVSGGFECEGETLCGALEWLPLRLARAYERVHAREPEYFASIDALCHPIQAGCITLADGERYLRLCCAGGAMFTPSSEIYGTKDGTLLLRPQSKLCAQLDLGMFKGSRELGCVLSFGARGTEGALPSRPVIEHTGIERVQGEALKLDAGDLALEFRARDDGVTLMPVNLGCGVARGEALLPLCRLLVARLEDRRKLCLTTDFGWKTVRARVTESMAEFYFAGARAVDALAIRVQALVTAPGRVEWTTEVLNSNAEYTVLSATYPGLTFEGGDLTLITPQNSGERVRRVFDGGYHHSGAYPNGFATPMPLYMLYDEGKQRANGLYIAVHDAGGARKDMRVNAFECGQGAIEYRFGAINMGEPANAFALAGKLVWQSFSGDWYDGAQIYKQFVTSQARWLPAFGRPDTPDWMRDAPLYIMDWMPNDNPDADPIPVSIRPAGEQPDDAWYKLPIKLARALGGVPIGYHLYNWHWIPFNNDFPHYFPVKPALKQGVLEMREHGIYTMPYINGRLWDTLDRRDTDYQYTSVAKPHATKRLWGREEVETYASYEPNGELCKLAAMCPTSNVWRDKLSEIAGKLFDEYSMGAVYVDQVAAAGVNMCADKSHAHTPGNGDWWVSAYRLIMARLRGEMPEGRGFTTESNAETYMSSFDGYLTWAWINCNMVPVFPQIYAGYIQLFGRNTNGYKKPDLTHFRYHAAQSVMFGQQIGWINADVADDEAKLAFLKTAVEIRYACREFFARGVMLRPPRVNCADTFVTDTGMGRAELFVGACALAGAWRLDGRVIVMAAAVDGKRRAFTLEFSKDEYDIDIDSLRKTLGEGDIELTEGGLAVNTSSMLLVEFAAKRQ